MDLAPSTLSLDSFKVQQNKRNAEKDIEPPKEKKPKQDDTIEIKFSEHKPEIYKKLSENKTSKIRIIVDQRKNKLLQKWFSGLQTSSGLGDPNFSNLLADIDDTSLLHDLLNKPNNPSDADVMDNYDFSFLNDPPTPPAHQYGTFNTNPTNPDPMSNSFDINLTPSIIQQAPPLDHNRTLSTNSTIPDPMSNDLDIDWKLFDELQSSPVDDVEQYRDQFLNNIVSIEYIVSPGTFYHNIIPHQLEYVRFDPNYEIRREAVFSISPVVIKITPRLASNNWRVSSRFELSNRTNTHYKDLRDIQNIFEKITAEKNLENLIREHKNNDSDSIDELIYNKLGGNIFWKLQPNWLRNDLVILFFPGIGSNEVTNVRMFKEHMNSLLDNVHSDKQIGTTENFTIVYYGVQFKFVIKKSANEEINFMLNLSGLIRPVENNVDIQDKLLVDLFYNHGYLYIKSFYPLENDQNMDNILQNIFDRMSLQNDNKRGKTTKRELLFIRLIANLIRSTGRNVVGIRVESNNENKTDEKWQELQEQIGWETRNMGDGKKNTVDNLKNYGFFGIGMKGVSKEGNMTTFEPWVKNTGAIF